jgi:hypothetical protein
MKYLQIQSELAAHGLDPSLTWAILSEDELEAWSTSWEDLGEEDYELDLSEDGQ